MRIGLSTSVMERGQTGVSRYILSLTRAFLPLQDQHRFTLFVLEKDRPFFSFAQEAMDVVPVPEQFRSPVRNILWHQRVLPGLAQQHQLQVLHVPSYRRMLWPRPCALVATIHDLAPFHVSRKYDWKRMLYGRYGARLLAHRQHQLIAISRSTARDLISFFGLPPKRISVIYNGLAHEQFSPGPSEPAKNILAARFGLEQPFFLYVARLEHPGKNHLRLIAAFNQFKAETHAAWQLVLVGKDWTGADLIHTVVRQSPFAKDIRCLGFVPDQFLPTLYRAAEALVCPSLFEGFGLPLIEAMACGCPVLCSTAGSLTEVVHGAALTVDPENIPLFKETMVRLAFSPKLRLHLRQAGLAQAQQFNWEKTAAATLDVYRRAFLQTHSSST